ncbi:MAG: PTS sugar transporter subunit IIA [Deltaproteobacteria bacterium]|nr:PTS sugar transporter subunit IIA [Deltaproteobacteria bacterium]
MRLSDAIREEYIITELRASFKEEALAEMVGYLAGRMNGLDREKAIEALLAREHLGTTGIGHGVAIPHCKLKGVSEIRVSFARSGRGVDFDSMDRMPVHLVFLIIAPENSAAAHLKILASISRLLKNQDFRERLMRALTKEEILNIIAEADKKNGLL